MAKSDTAPWFRLAPHPDDGGGNSEACSGTASGVSVGETGIAVGVPPDGGGGVTVSDVA